KVREVSGIRIQAYREGPIFPEPKKSGDKGAYGVHVPTGKPFRIVYYDDANTFIPASYPLAATSGVTHKINPVLYTGQKFIRVTRSAGLVNTRVGWKSLGGLGGASANGSSYIIVTDLGGLLRFQVFDPRGRMVSDVNETELKWQGGRIEAFKREFAFIKP